MNKITLSLDAFSMALLGGEAVVGTASGEWYVESYLARLWRFCAFWKESREVTVAEAFISALDSLEKNAERVDPDIWKGLSVQILKNLSDADLKANVIWRLHALKIRQGENLECVPHAELLAKAIEWKATQKQLTERNFTPRDEEELGKLPTALAELLLENKALRGSFFAWLLRDEGDVTLFTQFPAAFKLFEKCALGGTFKFLKGGGYKIEGGKLFLPIKAREGDIYQWIWDTTPITFPLGRVRTLDEIFREFKQRNKMWSNFLWSNEGIENWNSVEWGWQDRTGNYQRPELVKDAWYLHLPKTEVLSYEEVVRRYGSGFSRTSYGVALRATQKVARLDIDRTHSYIELLIPNIEGSYNVIHIGKFTKTLPQSFLELVGILGATVPAALSSHDSNPSNTGRYQTWHTAVVTEDQFKIVAEAVRLSVLETLDGKMPFSIYANSCSDWSQEIFNLAESGDFFTIDLTEVESTSWMIQACVAFIRFFPEALQPTAARLCILCFFSSRGMMHLDEEGVLRKERLYGSQAWQRGDFKNPSKLFKLQREGVLSFAGTPPDWMR